MAEFRSVDDSKAIKASLEIHRAGSRISQVEMDLAHWDLEIKDGRLLATPKCNIGKPDVDRPTTPD